MRTVVSGQFELPVAATAAIVYFTPEGERAWVPEWNPVYPSGESSESPGTVFTTEHGDLETVWIVDRISRGTGSAAYWRVTPGHHAGKVRVDCVDQPGGGCRVSVTYDLTLLPGAEPSGLNSYDEPSFAAMMEEWATAVAGAL